MGHFEVRFRKAFLVTELTEDGESYKVQLHADILPYPEKCMYHLSLPTVLKFTSYHNKEGSGIAELSLLFLICLLHLWSIIAVDVVGIHYSFDEWQTTHKALADYLGEHPFPRRREEGPKPKRRPNDSQFIVEIPLYDQLLDPGKAKLWFAVYAARPTHDWEAHIVWDNNNNWNYELKPESLPRRN